MCGQVYGNVAMEMSHRDSLAPEEVMYVDHIVIYTYTYVICIYVYIFVSMYM